MDSNYRRLKYVRYADDFLIGVIGSKEDSQRIKTDIKEYLESKLKLELSDEKTLITHGNQPAKFLGFDVCIRKQTMPREIKRSIETFLREQSRLESDYCSYAEETFSTRCRQD